MRALCAAYRVVRCVDAIYMGELRLVRIRWRMRPVGRE